MTLMPDPQLYRFYEPYAEACHLAGVQSISADAWVRLKTKAAQGPTLAELAQQVTDLKRRMDAWEGK